MTMILDREYLYLKKRRGTIIFYLMNQRDCSSKKNEYETNAHVAGTEL